MQQQNFTTTIVVSQTAQQVFDAVNNVRGWWTENIEGHTDQLNSTYLYWYKDVHRCKIKVTALVPGKKVEWEVLENFLKFTEDKNEWKGTHIVFDITEKEGKTELRFTHVGLTEHDECYQVCREAWTHFIQDSLGSLITTGKGQPSLKDEEGFNAALIEKWDLN
jgi:hypothetical protein